jgi:hypothetical protein
MGQVTGPTSRVAAVNDVQAHRRRRRQGSENRNMGGRLVVRYDRDKLQALEEVAGSQLPSLIRECGDLLTQLLPVAGERGVDPMDLLRQTARAVAASV